MGVKEESPTMQTTFSLAFPNVVYRHQCTRREIEKRFNALNETASMCQ